MTSDLSPAMMVRKVLTDKKDEFAALMPKGMTPARLSQIYITEIKGNPKLLACTVDSLLTCIIESARLGLDPGGVLGYCYFIPYSKDATFQLGYAGICELLYRTGRVGPITTMQVYKGEKFEFGRGSDEYIHHTPSKDATFPDDEITHFYSYCTLDGRFSFEVMTKGEVDRIRKKAKSQGIWNEHYVEMGKKTVLKRHSKRLPKSVEAGNAIQQDNVKEFGAKEIINIDVGEPEDEKDLRDWQKEALEMERLDEPKKLAGSKH